ncbi:MAG: bifunctional metallophosphatase/5'-nucleotidase [Anaerolineae bacterium]|nr:bifunctional metallophosphatase/5'-nucleotidase [Anaerolineae bacterium]
MRIKRIVGFALVLLIALAACRPTASPPVGAASRRLIILYTSDEHGWIEATEETGGAAGLLGLWREKEGYGSADNILVLSGGDMWTGPAISTWFKGESTVETMNAMGYHAAAVGNHEFDFGLDVLRERVAQMNFPLLAANLIERATGQVPDFARPYLVQEVNGIKVGLIGLATVDTPLVTLPENVAAFEFQAYEPVLREVVPKVKAEGAQVLMVVSHLCPDEMYALAPAAKALGIAAIGGGHCHARIGQVVDGVALIEAGSNLEAYARAEVVVNAAGEVIEVTAYTRANEGGTPAPAVAEIVQNWRARTDEALAQPIGYVENEIAQRSEAMLDMVVDAWLMAYPADVALCNRGSFRQAIPAGEITLETIIGVLPFNNVLVDVELSGRELLENIDCCNPVLGDIAPDEIDPLATYHVLVNDYMYGGGDGYRLKEHDPDAYHTGIDWRQPVIDWLISLGTSPDNPLDQYLGK